MTEPLLNEHLKKLLGAQRPPCLSFLILPAGEMPTDTGLAALYRF